MFPVIGVLALSTPLNRNLLCFLKSPQWAPPFSLHTSVHLMDKIPWGRAQSLASYKAGSMGQTLNSGKRGTKIHAEKFLPFSCLTCTALRGLLANWEKSCMVKNSRYTCCAGLSQSGMWCEAVVWDWSSLPVVFLLVLTKGPKHPIQLPWVLVADSLS